MNIRRSLIRIFIIVFCILSFTKSFSQFNLNDPILSDDNVATGKLSNGLTYYVRSNQRNVKNVYMQLIVKAGSVLEDDDQQGLAHFMEHMNFEGTKHFPKNKLQNYLQSRGVNFGADVNAVTGFDETTYILTLPEDNDDDIDKGFTILEDWAQNALLDTMGINKERDIVLEESRLRKNAQERLQKMYMPALLSGSKYAQRIPIGKDSIIKSFRPETLKKFYKTWYRPDLMAVIIVGNVDTTFAKQEIEDHFNDYKNPSNETPRPEIIPLADRKNDEAMVLSDKEQTSKLLKVFHYVERTPSIVTWGDYRKWILEQLFIRIINERLQGITQQANPPFLTGSTAFTSLQKGYRTFDSYISVGDKPVERAIDTLVNVLQTIKTFGVLQTELDRVKSKLLNQAEVASEENNKTSSSRFVQECAYNFLDNYPIVNNNEAYTFVKQILPGITVEEVNAFTERLSDRQGKFLLLLKPENDISTDTSGTALISMFTTAQKIPVKAFEEKKLDASFLDKQPSGGSIVEETMNGPLLTTNFKLNNGVTVTLKQTSFKNDEILMDAWRWGGSHNYGLANKENAEFISKIVQAMGVKNLSGADVTKMLAGKTVTVTPYINNYEEGIEGHCSATDFQAFIQLIYLYFTQPQKDTIAFQSYIDKQKNVFENAKVNPNNYLYDTLTKIEYKNSPWVQSLPTSSDFDKINLDTAFNIYKEIFSNAYGMHFTFVGNFDVVRMKKALEIYLGALPASTIDNKFTDEGMRPATGIVSQVIKKGEEKRSQICLVFTGEATYNHEEELKLKMLTQVLNLEIFDKLRQEMGDIYSATVTYSLNQRPYAHYSINIQLPCGPENVDKLTDALFALIKDLREDGVDHKYFDKVQTIFRAHNAGLLKQNSYWLNSLSHSWINGLDPQWIVGEDDLIQSLSAKDIKKTAQKYFNMDNYIKVVLNPE